MLSEENELKVLGTSMDIELKFDSHALNITWKLIKN